MNLRLACGIIIIVCCYHSAAQQIGTSRVESDYRNFRETFKQEFSNIDSATKPNSISIHPALLPDWLMEIPKAYGDVIYAIGISDPGMPEKEAVELATLRAKIISALLFNPEISSISDNFLNEVKQSSGDHFVTKYANYYRIYSSLIAGPEQFQIVNQHFTSFGESVVLIQYMPSISTINAVDSLMVKIDIYQAERQQKNKFEFEEKCEVYGLSKRNIEKEEIDIFYYFYRSINLFYEIVSRYNGENIPFPENIFRYQSLLPEKFSGDNQVSYKLTNGLWKAYLQSIIQTYSQSFTNLELEVSQIGDNYTSKAQNLSRDRTKANPSLRLFGLHVHNNRLSVILKNDEIKH